MPRLEALGWTDHFESQLAAEDAAFAPMRLSTVHRSRLTAFRAEGGTAVKLSLPTQARTTDFAVGDWVLANPETLMLHRRLDRHTLLDRRTAASPVPQLIAANVDTLFIVTSCNADFNAARLERYLALANEAGTNPVILLTKADTTDDAARYQREAQALQRGLIALLLNAKAGDAAGLLAPWCGPGQTVALIGSSGVGKSTLLNTLAGPDQDAPQETGDIRANDAKGRHTTTSRSLHAIAGGGWVIDTPGMRSLQVADVTGGLDTLFAEITELAPLCRFRDCTHAHEPGCAVQAAIAAGTLDPARMERWRKLRGENAGNTPATTRRATRDAAQPKRKR
jgi:ribosome biogenesis GTPase / thiamine phosphate phosphatase